MTENTYSFSADISQLMYLIINTMYSNKDIFLRELISNSSDSLNKLRYKSLINPQTLKNEPDLKIDIIPNEIENTLTIQDTGIGMTKSDLINNLGVIAKSGTKSFIETLKNNKDMSMIGQFGIGFYSAYLVAEKVEVFSKNDEDEQYCWSSNAGGTFSVNLDTESQRIKRGTRIVLHLKEDSKDYLSEEKLKELIKKHSEFISFPIHLLVIVKKEESFQKQMMNNIQEQMSVKIQEEMISKFTNGQNVTSDIREKLTEQLDKTFKKKEIISKEFELINKEKPIWIRNKKDVTKNEYLSFYKHITTKESNYLHVEHFSIEGHMEIKAILFIPEKAPFDMFNTNHNKPNIKLYVKRVFIMDECRELIPDYFYFINGIVDSEDLPLNISREILQQNIIMKNIKKHIVKRCIQMFTELSENNEKYKSFYKEYSKNLKLATYNDSDNMVKFAKLLRFDSSSILSEQISLDSYIQEMSENQEFIYYIAGESVTILKNSPFLERLRVKKYNVLFMIDPMDEYILRKLTEYSDKKFMCITKEDFSLNETKEEKEQFEEYQKDTEEICKIIQEILKDFLEKVVVSKRLTYSPCCLVTPNNSNTANVQRIMKAHTLGNEIYNYDTKKILEINPIHPIIKYLNKIYIDSNEEVLKHFIYLLYDTSLLSSGFSHGDPAMFSDRIIRFVSFSSGIDVLPFPFENVCNLEHTCQKEIEDVNTHQEDIAEEIQKD